MEAFGDLLLFLGVLRALQGFESVPRVLGSYWDGLCGNLPVVLVLYMFLREIYDDIAQCRHYMSAVFVK